MRQTEDISLFERRVNPHLGRLLRQLRLNKAFVSGRGCELYDKTGKRYLDFVAAYGALPFGFNPDRIWEAVMQVRAGEEPSFVQPSDLQAAGALADKLLALAPGEMAYVTFTNSGAESVEAAIKLARAATGRQRVLATWNSFHGKTLGALSATGKPAYQNAFGAPVPGFDYITYGSVEALQERLEEHGEEYAAFIVEPIQGEGGVIVPPAGYLKEAERLCRKHGLVLIFDEVQTGLGRTGRLFAAEEEGVRPDVITLAKALGGGLVPIGAVLCTADVYSEDFALKHSSTFAGNTLACRVGLAALKWLQEPQLLDNVKCRGEQLVAGLRRLQRQYPDIVADVRGRGLLIGLDLGKDSDRFSGRLLGMLADQGNLAPLVASYLLNRHSLRVAPTLNGDSVLRIEPPLIVSQEECAQALTALEEAVRLLAERNTAELVRHLLDEGHVERTAEGMLPSSKTKPSVITVASQNAEGRQEAGGPAAVSTREEHYAIPESPRPEEGRFAFLVHPLDLENYVEFDETLGVFSHDELRKLASVYNDLTEPGVVGKMRVVSQTGASAYGEFIAVARTANELLHLPKQQVQQELEQAVLLAAERGAGIVGLGAYTSVVSNGGRKLLKLGVPLTTGNSYTVVTAVEAITKALDRMGGDLELATVAVLGAGGAVGKATSLLLAEQAARIVLIGNPARPEKTRRRLLRLAGEICRHIVYLAQNEGRQFAPGTLAARLLEDERLPRQADVSLREFISFVKKAEADLPLVMTTDAKHWMPHADVVVTATSSVNALITPDMLKCGAVVCDMSRPANVSSAVKKERPDVLVIDGGIVEVPGRPPLGWYFGFEKGIAYACMSETMMLALEKHYENTSIGANLSLEGLLYARKLAAKHGFRLAGLRSFDRPLTESEWKRFCQARGEALKARGVTVTPLPDEELVVSQGS